MAPVTVGVKPSGIIVPHHVFVLLLSSEDGTAYSFGENKLGQLGQGNQTDAVLSPAPVSHHCHTEHTLL